jgi:hypothetical protein
MPVDTPNALKILWKLEPVRMKIQQIQEAVRTAAA